MFIIQLMIGIIASVGIGYILCDVLKVPSIQRAFRASNPCRVCRRQRIHSDGLLYAARSHQGDLQST